jgi:cell division protein FtsL
MNLRLKESFRFGFILNIWLLLMVIGTALLLVRWQYNSRNLFVTLEKAESTSKQLAANHASILAEKRQLSSPARVERVAKPRDESR